MYNIDFYLSTDNENKVNSVEIDNILQSIDMQLDTRFLFSAIIKQTKPRVYHIKLNCTEDDIYNLHSIAEIIELIESSPERDTLFLRPQLEAFLMVFKPALLSICHKMYPIYKKIVPEFEELKCILNYCIVNLYDKGYYLHLRLISRAFTNHLNMMARKICPYGDLISLDTKVNSDECDKEAITLLDTLENPESSQIAYEQTHYTVDDYNKDLYQALKTLMIKEIGELRFEHIMIQLKTKTLDNSSSKVLERYRRRFRTEGGRR